jgi:hypothetical protein
VETRSRNCGSRKVKNEFVIEILRGGARDMRNRTEDRNETIARTRRVARAVARHVEAARYLAAQWFVAAVLVPLMSSPTP